MNVAIAICSLLAPASPQSADLFAFSVKARALYRCSMDDGRVRRIPLVNGNMNGIRWATDIIAGSRTGQYFVTTRDENDGSSLLEIREGSLKDARVVSRTLLPSYTSSVVLDSKGKHLFAISWNGQVARYSLSQKGGAPRKCALTAGAGSLSPSLQRAVMVGDHALAVGWSDSSMIDTSFGGLRIYTHLYGSNKMRLGSSFDTPKGLADLAVRADHSELWALAGDGEILRYVERTSKHWSLAGKLATVRARCLAFTEDGKTLYVVDLDNNIRTYSVGHNGSLTLLTVSNAGNVENGPISRLGLRDHRLVGLIGGPHDCQVLVWKVGADARLGVPLKIVIRADQVVTTLD